MVTAASLAIRFDTNADKAGREVDVLGNKVKGLASTWKQSFSIGVGMVGAQVLTSIVRGGVSEINSIVGAASDLNETKNKALVVFGADLNKGLVDWAKDAAQNMGLSREQAMAAVATQGNFFQAQGTDAKTALKEGETLVQLAADLASYNNIDPSEVLANLGSGLAGEAEPLRKYGIDVSDAAVQNEALAEGINKSTSEMTMAEKSQLRYNIIMKQTVKAQGDYGRTSGSLANLQRTLAGKILDLKAALGGALLPVFIAGAGLAIGLVTAFERLTHTIGGLTDAFGKFLEHLSAISGLTSAVTKFAKHFAVGFNQIRHGLDLVTNAFKAGGFKQALETLFGEAGEVILRGIGKMFASVPRLIGDFLRNFETGFKPLDNLIHDVGQMFTSGGLLIQHILQGEWGKALDDAKGFILARIKAFIDVIKLEFALVNIGLNLAIDSAVSLGGWLWNHKGDIWGGIKELAEWTTDTFTDEITATIDGSIELLGDIGDAAGDLYGWVTRQLLGPGMGDGTGEAGANTIPLGTVLVDGLLALGEYLAGIAADFGAWVKPLILGAWDKTLDIGSTLIDGAIDLGTDLMVISADFGAWLKPKLLGAWDNALDIGTATISALVDLAGDLASLRDDAETWIKTAIDWTTDKTVNVGKLILNADVEVHDTSGNDAKPGRSFVQRIIDGAVGALPEIDRANMFLAEKWGQGLGLAVGSFAGLLFDTGVLVVSGVIKGITDPASISRGLTAVSDWFSGAVVAGFEYAASTFDTMAGGFWGSLQTSFMASVPDNLFDGITKPFKDFFSGTAASAGFGPMGIPATVAVPSGISTMWDDIKAALTPDLSGIDPPTFPDWIKDIPTLFKPVLDFFSSSSAIVTTLGTTWDSIKTALTIDLSGIDKPSLPSWLETNWSWITKPLDDLKGYIDDLTGAIAELLGLKSQAAAITANNLPVAGVDYPIATQPPPIQAGPPIPGEDPSGHIPLGIVFQPTPEALKAQAASTISGGDAIGIPVKPVFGAPAGGIGSQLKGLFGGGEETSFKATFDLDIQKAGANVAIAMQWGLDWDTRTFIADYDLNIDLAGGKVVTAMIWGLDWDSRVFIADYDLNIDPAGGQVVTAMIWGLDWDSRVFTASFDIDTSGLIAASAVADQVAAHIAAVMPHSPAKEGPLSKPISFGYIAENLADAMSKMGPYAERGMGDIADRLHRRMGVDLAGNMGKWQYADGRGGGGQTFQGPTININAPVYGVQHLEDTIIDTYTGKIIPAHISAMKRHYRSLGEQA